MKNLKEFEDELKLTEDDLTEKDDDRAVDRETTEKRQNAENQSSVKKEAGESKINWVELIDEGRELPSTEDKISWIGFKKAWRGWYSQSINPDATPSTRAENRARYDRGAEHVRSQGYDIKEHEHTATVVLVKRDDTFYDTDEKPLSLKEVEKRQYGYTTGWTEYENEAA